MDGVKASLAALRFLIKASGTNQTEVGRRLGITGKKMSKMMTGAQTLPLATEVRILEEIGFGQAIYGQLSELMAIAGELVARHDGPPPDTETEIILRLAALRRRLQRSPDELVEDQASEEVEKDLRRIIIQVQEIGIALHRLQDRVGRGR